MQRRGPELHHPTPTHPPNPYAIPSSPPLMDHGASLASTSSEYQRFSSPPASSRTAYPDPQSMYAASPQYPQYQPGPRAPPSAPGNPAAPPLDWEGFNPANAPWANDATAQMGVQIGKNAFNAGQDYFSKNVTRHLPVQHLRHAFNVSNSYVLHKLRLVLFPWRHKPWSRLVHRSESSGQAEGYRPPREDVNAPDLYIPVMALVTYILLSGMVYGFRQDFHPERLGMTASKSFAVVLVEFCAIKLGCYLLNIGGEGTVLDLFAYSGYKFVGIIVTLMADLVRIRGWMWWATFFYVFCANAFFLLRSLRNVVLPDPSFASSNPVSHAQRRRRLHFLFAIAVSQLASMWLLVRV